MSDWQPIETAPRDGTTFIATDGNEVEPVYYVRYSHWSVGEYDLRYSSRQEGEESLWFNPTHWMPLPKPPEDAR